MFRKIFCIAASAIIACISVQAQSLEPSGYSPVEFHQIDLGTAKTYTGRFQAMNAASAISTVGGTISATSVRALLNTRGAVYLREYFALDEQGALHILLVPKTANNHDIILPRITDANGSTVAETTARKWIKNYAASPTFSQYGGVYSSSIHRDAVLAVISKNNATSLRFYFAAEPDGRAGTVVSGVTAQNVESSTYIADRNCCPPLEEGKGELAQ